jgi:hypothetical protein
MKIHQMQNSAQDVIICTLTSQPAVNKYSDIFSILQQLVPSHFKPEWKFLQMEAAKIQAYETYTVMSKRTNVFAKLLKKADM